jgi:hypothetical protein
MDRSSGQGRVPQVDWREAGDRSVLGRLAIIGSTVCGMAAAATPLLLWMAPTPTILYLTFLWGFVACLGVIGCMKYMPEHRHEMMALEMAKSGPESGPPRP